MQRTGTRRYLRPPAPAPEWGLTQILPDVWARPHLALLSPAGQSPPLGAAGQD
jgi:hypothetical protein